MQRNPLSTKRTRHKKFGNLTLADYISPFIKPIGIVLYIVFIVDLSPLQRGIACKDRAFMEGAALVSVRVAPQKLLPKSTFPFFCWNSLSFCLQMLAAECQSQVCAWHLYISPANFFSLCMTQAAVTLVNRCHVCPFKTRPVQ